MDEPFGVGEGLIVLLEITADIEGKYNYTTNEDGEIIYTYFEAFCCLYCASCILTQQIIDKLY